MHSCAVPFVAHKCTLQLLPGVRHAVKKFDNTGLQRILRTDDQQTFLLNQRKFLIYPLAAGRRVTGFGGLQAMICAMMYFAMARQRSALAHCAVVSLMRLRSACTLVSIAMAASLATCREVMIRLSVPHARSFCRLR